jgi:hypothetical protein
VAQLVSRGRHASLRGSFYDPDFVACRRIADRSHFSGRCFASPSFASRCFTSRCFTSRCFASRRFASRRFASRRFASRRFADHGCCRRRFCRRGTAARRLARSRIAGRGFTGGWIRRKNPGVANEKNEVHSSAPDEPLGPAVPHPDLDRFATDAAHAPSRGRTGLRRPTAPGKEGSPLISNIHSFSAANKGQQSRRCSNSSGTDRYKPGAILGAIVTTFKSQDHMRKAWPQEWPPTMAIRPSAPARCACPAECASPLWLSGRVRPARHGEPGRVRPARHAYPAECASPLWLSGRVRPARHGESG